MTAIQLDEQTVQALKAQAAARGLTVEEYLRELAMLHVNAEVEQDGENAAQDFDRALDELFAADSRTLPDADLTYSRQDIYLDHD